MAANRFVTVIVTCRGLGLNFRPRLTSARYGDGVSTDDGAVADCCGDGVEVLELASGSGDATVGAGVW